MKEIIVAKAISIDTVSVESATIKIAGVVPTLNGRASEWMPESSKFYDDEARRLADVLFDSLPGGTLDRLLAEMLTRKASHFRVSSWRTRQ